MSNKQDDFAKRVRRIQSSNDRVKVRSTAPIMSSKELGLKDPPLKSKPIWVRVLIAYLLFSMCKWLVVERIGEDHYHERLAELRLGDWKSQTAAFVLGPGLFTGGIGELMAWSAGLTGAAPAEEPVEEAPAPVVFPQNG